MNIFLFDPDLDVNAKYFHDKDKRRFNKQIVESLQLFAACMKKFYGITVYKLDGTPYTVDKILNHPACKWLLSSTKNHKWHCRYIESLLKLFPNHSCNKSYRDAVEQILTSYEIIDPEIYLCIANSDMSGLPAEATVFDKYKRHLENKHKMIQFVDNV